MFAALRAFLWPLAPHVDMGVRADHVQVTQRVFRKAGPRDEPRRNAGVVACLQDEFFLRTALRPHHHRAFGDHEMFRLEMQCGENLQAFGTLVMEKLASFAYELFSPSGELLQFPVHPGQHLFPAH